MPKKNLKSAAWDFAAILPFLCFCSCIVDSYEWDDIDTSINIQTDVGFPVGSSGVIYLATLLSLEPSSMLYEDADGNYSFSFTSDPTSQTIQIPSFSLNEGDFIKDVDFGFEDINLKYKTDKQFPWLNGSILNDPVAVTVDDIIEGGSTRGSFSVSEEVSDLVEHIEEISYIYLDAIVNAKISVNLDNNSKISFTGSRLTITLPDYMYISGNSGDLTIKEKHIIELDKKGLTGNKLEVSFQLDSIDMKALKDESSGELGYYVLSDDIPYLKIKGDVEISDLELDFYLQAGTTFDDIPTNVNFSIDLEFEAFSVTGVEVKMCSEVEIDDVDFELGSLFDFLEGNNNVIDLYNPVIFLDVANSTPVAAGFYSTLQSSADNYDVEIEIGNKDEPIIFGSYGDGSTYTSTIYFSSKAGVDMSSTSDENKNIVIDELSDIFSHLPDKISISDISLSAYYENEDDYTLIQFSGDTLDYGFEFSYGFDIPLAFDEGLSISYSYDIAGLWELFDSEYENSEVYVNVATLKMTFVNAIPLQMSLTASALGTDGNILNDESLKLELSSSDGGEAKILGGTVAYPQESVILLSLSAGGRVLEDLDGFRLNITAGTSEELAGRQLNSKQYIQIENISLHFNGGIDIEL